MIYPLKHLIDDLSCDYYNVFLQNSTLFYITLHCITFHEDTYPQMYNILYIYD